MYPPPAGGVEQINGMVLQYAHQTPKIPQEMPDNGVVSELAAVRGMQERQMLPGDLHGQEALTAAGARSDAFV